MQRLAVPSTLVTLVAAVLVATAGVSAQSGRLDAADKVRLLNCQPSTTVPVFRLTFNLVDSQGSPLPVKFGSQALSEHLKILVDDQPIERFFVSAHSTEAASSRGRIALILVDISGSMNRLLASGGSRFQAAQAALTQFVGAFDDRSDQIAIVPFESHNVISEIRSATFARTKAQALAQINSLPPPKPRNNTAIYSSIVAGIDLLNERLHGLSNAAGGTSPEALLIIMTDGKNEILPGDDPGLLDGASGLTRASDVVKASGVQVIGIGFGEAGAVDEEALARISTKFFRAADSDKLRQVFAIAHTLLTDRIAVTFNSPWEDRATLEGRTVRVTASLNLGPGQEFDSRELAWAAPQMGVPTFDDRCDTDELRAWLPRGPTGNGWISTLRPFLVFLGIGALLLVLWFWVPRLVWSEQYVGNLPKPSRGRWAAASQVSADERHRPSRPAPPGFEGGRGGGQPPRGASDRTVVSPDADFSKSRLQPYPPDRGRS
jgi:hypothetical protein